MQIQQTTKEITKTINPIIDKVDQWRVDGLKMLPNMVIAIIFMTLFVFFARFVRRILTRYLSRVMTNNSGIGIISNLSYFLVIILGLMITLPIVGLDQTANKFLAGAGIIGVALGFAIQDTASNFISGTLMAFRSGFKVGDLIETNGTVAVVEQIDLRSTQLKDLNGYQIIIPNKEIFQNKLINYNKYATRRLSLECGVAYDSNLDVVERETLKVLENIEEIKSSPSPIFHYTEFGESSINYKVHFWIDYLTMTDYLDAQHLAIKAIKKKYNELGVEIPFPITTVELKK